MTLSSELIDMLHQLTDAQKLEAMRILIDDLAANRDTIEAAEFRHEVRYGRSGLATALQEILDEHISED